MHEVDARADYGRDLLVDLTENGEITGAVAGIQVKGDRRFFRDNATWVLSASPKDARFWADSSIPVVGVLRDPDTGDSGRAAADRAPRPGDRGGGWHRVRRAGAVGLRRQRRHRAGVGSRHRRPGRAAADRARRRRRGYACRWWPEVNQWRPRRATSAPRVCRTSAATSSTVWVGCPADRDPGPWRRDLCRRATRSTERGNPGRRRGQMRAHHLDRAIVLVDVGGL